MSPEGPYAELRIREELWLATATNDIAETVDNLSHLEIRLASILDKAKISGQSRIDAEKGLLITRYLQSRTRRRHGTQLNKASSVQDVAFHLAHLFDASESLGEFDTGLVATLLELRVTPQSFNKLRSDLRSFFNSSGLTTGIDWDDEELHMDVPGNRYRILSRDEIDQLSEQLTGKDRAGVVLAGKCGLRVSEIGRLSKSSLDLEPDGYVYVSRSKNRLSRRIPWRGWLSDDELEVLKEVFGQGGRPFGRTRGRTYVFADRLKRILRAAGHDGVTGHGLRRSAANWWYPQFNYDVGAVSRRLGHQSTETTTAYYLCNWEAWRAELVLASESQDHPAYRLVCAPAWSSGLAGR